MLRVIDFQINLIRDKLEIVNITLLELQKIYSRLCKKLRTNLYIMTIIVGKKTFPHHLTIFTQGCTGEVFGVWSTTSLGWEQSSTKEVYLWGLA